MAFARLANIRHYVLSYEDMLASSISDLALVKKLLRPTCKLLCISRLRRKGTTNLPYPAITGKDVQHKILYIIS